MDWNRIRTFYYTAKAGTFSAAALDLHMNQSSISRQVILLERSLNHPLLNRQLNNLHLTEAGEVLFQAVEKMLREMKAAHVSVADLQSKTEDILTVVTTSGVSARFLIAYLSKFCKAHPKLRLKILNSDQVTNITTQEVDAIIVPLQSIPEGYAGEYLTSFNFALFASKGYVQHYGVPNEPQDLNHHRLIAYGDRNRHYQQSDWFLSLGVPEEAVRYANIAINSRQGILRIVKRGAGIAALDQHIGENEGLVRVLPQIKGPEIDLYYAYPNYLRNASKIRALGKFLHMVVQLENQRINKPAPDTPKVLSVNGVLSAKSALKVNSHN